jgi:hypothetical protein
MMDPGFEVEALERALELVRTSVDCVKGHPRGHRDRHEAEEVCLAAYEELQEELREALDWCGDDELVAIAELLLKAKRK